MLRDNITLAQCKKYKYPHGAVYIGPSDQTISAGFLELSPSRSTPKMTRPLPEHVRQIKGSCEIEMFDYKNRITIKKLEAGDAFVVPTNIIRVHRNRGRKISLNYWEYQGNATSLVSQMVSGGILDQNHQSNTSVSFFSLQDCQAYQLPSGKIYFGQSDKSKSVGYLELKPGMTLDKHSRPVEENLIQINGESELELFNDNNQIKVVKLRATDKLTIPANQFHLHANNSGKTSLTYWQFNGDITEIIAQIKSQAIKI